MQQQILYDYSSLTITLTLFVMIVVANESGFRLGRFIQSRTDDEIRTLTGSIQASILGLLALLLGFSFSMSMQRFDSRSQALIAEANAIGTVVLRAELLLFVVFIASGGILGYSSGLSGHRVVAPTLMVSFLIALIVLIIIDLDRPKRGLIQVNQNSLILLQQERRE